MSETSDTQPARRGISLRSTATATVTVMLVVLGFLLVLSIRNVLVSVFLGLLLATALRPVMSKLREGRLPSFAAASLAVLLMLSLVAGFLVLVVPLIVAQVSALLTDLPRLYADLREGLLASRVLIVRQIGYRLDPALPQPSGEGDEIAGMGDVLLDYLPVAGYALFVTLCTLVFTYYWLLYRERSIRGLLLLLPMERREAAEVLWLQIESRIGAFLRGQTLLALMTGVFSLVGYSLVGIPFALLLALIGAVLEFVPFLGPFIATGVAVAAGLSVSPEVGLGALLVGLVIQQVQNVFFAPRIMDKAVGVSPVVTLLAFVGFSALFGPAGSLLAIPLAASLQVLFTAWIERSGAAADVTPAGRTMADRLRYAVRELASDIAGHLRQKEAAADGDADETEEALEQLLQDLDALIADEPTPALAGLAATEAAAARAVGA